MAAAATTSFELFFRRTSGARFNATVYALIPFTLHHHLNVEGIGESVWLDIPSLKTHPKRENMTCLTLDNNHFAITPNIFTSIRILSRGVVCLVRNNVLVMLEAHDGREAFIEQATDAALLAGKTALSCLLPINQAGELAWLRNLGSDAIDAHRGICGSI